MAPKSFCGPDIWGGKLAALLLVAAFTLIMPSPLSPADRLAKGVTVSGDAKHCLTAEFAGSLLLVLDREIRFANGCKKSVTLYWSNECEANKKKSSGYNYSAKVHHGHSFFWPVSEDSCTLDNADFCLSTQWPTKSCKFRIFFIFSGDSYETTGQAENGSHTWKRAPNVGSSDLTSSRKKRAEKSRIKSRKRAR